MNDTEKETESIPPPRRGRGKWIVIGAVGVVFIIVAYGVTAGWFSSAATTTTLLGAGATFPYPLISKWSTEYQKLTGVQVNYQSIGSGGGISQVTQKLVDFGGTDAPLNATERTNAPNMVHIPETLGSVTLTYNLPGVGGGLNLTGPVIADIFLGTITNWNSVNITSLNPGISLPSQQISVVHRSDGSGTTFVFTSYLHRVSSGWGQGMVGKSVHWPVGIGASGNSGVTAQISQTPYSIGYVELVYAAANGLTYAKVKSAAGNFILPSLESTRIAADNAAQTLPRGEDSWSSVSILNPPGNGSYPISSFTYIIVYRELNVYGSSMTETKAKALVDFLWWIVHDGQQYSSALYYVPLPQPVIQLDEATISGITYNGQALR